MITTSKRLFETNIKDYVEFVASYNEEVEIIMPDGKTLKLEVKEQCVNTVKDVKM